MVVIVASQFLDGEYNTFLLTSKLHTLKLGRSRRSVHQRVISRAQSSECADCGTFRIGAMLLLLNSGVIINSTVPQSTVCTVQWTA